jgi:CheY-like chemotaxis protein
VTLPPEAIRLHADPTRLAQVFANLLNNAAKYMEPGGRIWLTAERAASEVVVRVRDAGVGIPAEMLPKVFDLFTQVDRSLDRSQGGLGIGLSLVQSLVQMHGGSVTASSDGAGSGSEFVVRLPVLVQALPATAGAPAADSTSNGTAVRVLLADDNVDASQSLAMLLRCQGHEATAVHEGQAALDAAKTRRPDIILLDIGLPGMDGFEVCRRLRRQAGLEQTLLVSLTGYGQDEDRRRSQEAGFHAHLVKPVGMAQLRDLLARAASRRADEAQ